MITPLLPDSAGCSTTASPRPSRSRIAEPLPAPVRPVAETGPGGAPPRGTLLDRLA